MKKCTIVKYQKLADVMSMQVKVLRYNIIKTNMRLIIMRHVVMAASTH